MAIKEFRYKIEGGQNVHFQLLENSEKVRFLERKDWRTEDNAGLVDSYVISPGFYVELASRAINTPIIAIGEEDKEEEFRKNLKDLLNLELEKKEI